MPRIEASTVAEHHTMRRAAIVEAARELLASGGPTAVTPAAVAGRAGLARTSVYQYYPSTDALVAAGVEETFAVANAALASAVDEAGSARGRLDAYVRNALALAAHDHAPVRGWGAAGLPPECLARVRELHAAMLAPLRSALAELGVADVGLATALVFGAVSAGAELVEHGGELEATTAGVVAFVAAGLGLGPG
jgi:AcrR family transcriptional regulator